jgi:hypothetical protein
MTYFKLRYAIHTLPYMIREHEMCIDLNKIYFKVQHIFYSATMLLPGLKLR